MYWRKTISWTRRTSGKRWASVYPWHKHKHGHGPVRSKADDPDESRRSLGMKADDLLGQSRRSFEPKQTIRRKQTIQKSMKADDPDQSRRSFSYYFYKSKQTILYQLKCMKADDPGQSRRSFSYCFEKWKQTILSLSFWMKADDHDQSGRSFKCFFVLKIFVC